MKKKGTLKRMIKGFFVRLEVYDTKQVYCENTFCDEPSDTYWTNIDIFV